MDVFDNIDPEILEDFLTESNELLEVLGQDLVVLEREPDNQDLLNRIFRALHTIKGSSSFLGLVPLTNFAHAAEDALNALRKAEAEVTADTMDLLLNAVDVIREQLEAVGEQRMPQAGPEDLAAALRRIGQGQPQRTEKRDQAGEADKAGAAPTLSLPDSKKDLLPYMVEDLTESLGRLRTAVEEIKPTRKATALPGEMLEIAEELTRSVGFFEVDCLTDEINTLHHALGEMENIDHELIGQFLPRLLALMEVIARRAAGLTELQLIDIHSDRLLERLEQLLNNQSLDQEVQVSPGAEIKEVFATDEVSQAHAASPAPAKTENAAPAEETPALNQAAKSDSPPAADSNSTKAPARERTIRVDVDRLEELLNLVGELVLQKNRVLGIGRQFSDQDKHGDLAEDFLQVGSDLDRITGDLQTGVMKTRMQPMSKLFNRYPRMIRDLARSTGKKIDLQIEGGDTEVDKSVIEALGDPLVHILRNSADHGVEMPDERAAAGKDEQGIIRVSARHEGNHVVVEIVDNGRGLNRQRIASKAVERGLISAEAAETLPDGEINKLIFAPGFSTAEKVSDLSGRGVGMDVVRTNITKLNGMVDIQSQCGQGTTVSIRIPLTLAIMQAMVVGVNGALYALPLSNILEIRRPDPAEISTVGGKNTLRLRDSVLPLFDLSELFDQNDDGQPAQIAVIVGLGEQRLGLLVHRLIGQQEVVIKPLDDMFENSDLMSGATVREDGGVSLILDVAAVFTRVNQQHHMAA